MEVRRVRFEGGAIKNPKKKERKMDEKIAQALAAQAQGGAIRKPKKRERRVDPKIQQALAAQAQGGGLYDEKHRYMMQKLSGRGAKHDSPQCRADMHSILSRYDPVFWNTYIAGEVKEPLKTNDHMIRTPRGRPVDARADIIEAGGSLHPISHSENGFLESHNTEFHHFLEIV